MGKDTGAAEQGGGRAPKKKAAEAEAVSFAFCLQKVLGGLNKCGDTN